MQLLLGSRDFCEGVSGSDSLGGAVCRMPGWLLRGPGVRPVHAVRPVLPAVRCGGRVHVLRAANGAYLPGALLKCVHLAGRLSVLSISSTVFSSA